MTIIRTNIPDKSLLFDKAKYNYVDSFQGTFVNHEKSLNSVDVGKAFFSSSPKWVKNLLGLRNKIVKNFGLKTSVAGDRKKTLDNFKGEKGEQVGLFRVFDKSDNEIILGEDDKHLDFRVSLFLDNLQNDKFEKKLTISTTVIFKNWFGRLYFLPVRPFHKLIVPAILRGTIKQLET
jgi:hypothetical protein